MAHPPNGNCQILVLLWVEGIPTLEEFEKAPAMAARCSKLWSFSSRTQEKSNGCRVIELMS
jgi:hypothetical protein